MVFDCFTGQEKVKKMLREAVASDRIGHAYMFTGPEGIGKKSFSGKFAEYVMCTSEGSCEDRPCGICESCRLLGEGFNPDCIVEGVPQGKATISVEIIRNIQEKLVTAPAYGRKKVIIIRNADKMTAQAQNALLKTLEEPPEYVVIILLCENKNLMLETVKSRVITVEFERNTESQISDFFLKTYGEDKKDRLPLVCAYCDGIMGRVHEFGDGKDSDKIRKAVPEIIGRISRDRFGAAKTFGDLLKKYEDRKSFAFFSMRSFYRDIQIAARYGRKAGLLNPDFEDKILELAGKIGYHDAAYDADVVDETWKMLGRNANLKLAIDRMMIFLR